MSKPLIDVQELSKYFSFTQGFFKRERKVVKAVDGVSFQIEEGETLGIVGESGCGKSTLGRMLMRLIEPTAGRVFFQGQDLTALRGQQLKQERKHFQMVFQDPYASLNPRMTIRQILEEPLETHNVYAGKREHKLKELCDAVGIPSAYLERYAHQLSGGQRQRIGIARALAVEPKFIVADEPVAALDVSIQAQILNLFRDLQKEMGLTYLFIAHDLSVVQYISQRVGVMYLGQLVELSSSDRLYERPLHPYTKALLSAIPVADPFAKKERIYLKGDIPNPVHPPSGCRFHPRCPFAKKECTTHAPEFREVESGHFVACHVV